MYLETTSVSIKKKKNNTKQIQNNLMPNRLSSVRGRFIVATPQSLSKRPSDA